MKQQRFEQEHEKDWIEIEAALDEKPDAETATRLASQYLVLCQHLALAKERSYDVALVERLNALVLRLYREVYRYKSASRFNFYGFFKREFPLSIYLHRRYIFVAFLFFCIPLFLAGGWVYFDDNAVYSVMDGSQVRQMESMYDPANRKLGREREADTDIYMFGFYVQNNISVAFRCFAGGLVFGLGSLLVLLFNGLSIGAVAGHLTRLEFGETFYPFVVGHGSFELTAIVFSGAAGLRLGYSLLNPGLNSRVGALRQAGKEVVPMLYGIILMLIIAAFLEAFWSSSASLPIFVKYMVGAILWGIVLLYCFSGRRFESR